MIKSPTMHRNKLFDWYLAFVSLLGMAFAVVITFRFGAGLSTDGARYLSTAASLLTGNGFTEYLGGPLTQFPPLYSILIAGGSLVTQADVFVVAQYLNIAAFGLTIWLAGKFIQTLFPEQLLYAYIASGLFATSPSLLRISANILSDMLFLAATLVFLINASAYLKTPSRRNLFLLSAVCALLPLLRYAGLAHIIAISLSLLVVPAGSLVKRALQAGAFAVVASLPTLLWVYFHSYLQSGILFGRRLPPDAQGNLQTTLEKAMHWFVPYSVVDIVREFCRPLEGLVPAPVRPQILTQSGVLSRLLERVDLQCELPGSALALYGPHPHHHPTVIAGAWLSDSAGTPTLLPAPDSPNHSAHGDGDGMPGLAGLPAQ
jgi:hypothetical protein